MSVKFWKHFEKHLSQDGVVQNCNTSHQCATTCSEELNMESLVFDLDVKSVILMRC